MKRTRQITIKDVARELKISVATVSRALRNTHDVSELTRKKVLKKCHQLGYHTGYSQNVKTITGKTVHAREPYETPRGIY